VKQASNSLLTLFPILFNAITSAPVVPRVKTGVDHRLLTPFYVRRDGMPYWFSLFLGLSCSPRSLVRFRLGEGRIRSLLRGICCVLLAGCLGGASTGLVSGAHGLAIELKEEAAIRSAMVFLKDVATLRGTDSGQLKKLAQISLGPSPEFGSVRTLTRHQICEIVRAAADTISEKNIAGAAAVQIRLQGRQVYAREITPLLMAHLLETTPWKKSEIRIGSIENLKSIELPPGDTVLRFDWNSAILGHRKLLAPIEIVQAGKTLRCFWITADIDIHAGILTAAKKIPLGKVVTAGDIVKMETDIGDLRASYVRDPEEILGKMSRRMYSSGDPLTREAFVNPFLVKNGETVQLRLERNGIVLTSMARAEQDGRLGQVIRVRNLDFSTVLKAQVTGRAEVMLQY
jgi:flagella basal body P-ring formation protein FlgA